MWEINIDSGEPLRGSLAQGSPDEYAALRRPAKLLLVTGLALEAADVFKLVRDDLVGL